MNVPYIQANGLGLISRWGRIGQKVNYNLLLEGKLETDDTATQPSLVPRP